VAELTAAGDKMTHTTRRRLLTSLGGIGIAVGTGAVGTAAAAGRGRRRGASGDSTIFDVVEGADDFSILELALEETGLDAVLDGDDQYTVFGPTDAAFAALLEALDATPAELLARDDLETILLYHVTEGRRYAPSILNPAAVEMLAGGTVTTEGTELNDGQASIVTDPPERFDIEAANGVIHTIDGVLLP
jgi:uncharacterized surface protein with fasciclin (FAS1) repeats